jgi:amidase
MPVISSIKSSVSHIGFDPHQSPDNVTDDVELVDGMPVGVQVVGGRFGEERCVAVAKAIEQAMRWKYAAPPSL